MLNHKISMYIPNNNSKQNKMVNNVFRMFCEEFGGATINPVFGGWIDGQGKLVTDKIVIVSSYTTTITRKVRLTIKKIAVEVREQLKEDTVMAVMDGHAEFY